MRGPARPIVTGLQGLTSNLPVSSLVYTLRGIGSEVAQVIEKVVLGAAGPLVAIAVFVALVLPSLGGDSGSPPDGSGAPGNLPAQASDGRVEGDPIVCGGGATSVESLELSGDKFRVVGQLMEREGDAARVAGPEGDVMVMLIPPANQATGFIVGDFVIVSGSVDEDGVGAATEIVPVCRGDTFVQEPVVDPTTEELPGAAPSESPQDPTQSESSPTPDDEDDGGRDNEERGNNGRGNQGNGGRGHGSDDGETDDEDEEYDEDEQYDEDD
jgi:hypothetical protein